MVKKVAIILGSLFFALGLFSLTPNILMGENGLFFTNTPLSLFYILVGTYILFSVTKSDRAILKSLQNTSVVLFAFVAIAIATKGFEAEYLFGIFSINIFNYFLQGALATLIVYLAGYAVRKNSH